MVWFVGILKRQLLAGCDPDSLPRKDRKKRAQALKFFGGERIDGDYFTILGLPLLPLLGFLRERNVVGQ